MVAPHRAVRIRRSIPVLALASVCALATIPAAAQAQELHVDRSGGRKVTFTSRAASLEFQGVTDAIDGYVVLDGHPLSESTGGGETSLYMEVDLASLDTGIGMRNRHMRDNYLEVDAYPYASFEGRIVRATPSGDGPFEVTASGTLTIHGVSRQRDILCAVAPLDTGYHAECRFNVLLSDHGIEIPKIMFLKLSNEIQLDLEFSVVPTQGSGS